MFYLTTHSTLFIYCYMASAIWHMTTQIVREETCRCRHMGYSFRLAARVLLYASSHRQDNTYYGLFFTPVVEHWLEREIAQWVHHEGSIRRQIAPCVNALTTELHYWESVTMHSLAKRFSGSAFLMDCSIRNVSPIMYYICNTKFQPLF